MLFPGKEVVEQASVEEVELTHKADIPEECLLCGIFLESLKPRRVLDLDGLPQERRADLVQGPASQSTASTVLLFGISVAEDHGMYLGRKRHEGGKRECWWYPLCEYE